MSSRQFVPIVQDTTATRRTLVLVGRHAASTDDFSLDDLPTSGGRMDIIARCVRAAFFLSDGIRHDTDLHVLLLGGNNAPTTLHIDGSTVRFLRADERRLAELLRRALGVPDRDREALFVAPGIRRARIGLEACLTSAWTRPVFVLDKSGADIRSVEVDSNATFVLGDHTGLSDEELSWLDRHGATRLSLGPVDIHAEDAIAILHNEMDRRRASAIGRECNHVPTAAPRGITSNTP